MPKDRKGRMVLDSKVNHAGRGRLLAVGKLLPDDFDWVRVTVTRTRQGEVWLHIKQLVLSEAA